MVYRFEKTMTDKDLVALLERFKSDRSKTEGRNFMQFFGALPNIGDGLEYQKSVRNEWA